MENASSSQNGLPGSIADRFSEELFELLFEFEENAILITDAAGFITTCNSGAEQLYGHSCYDMVSKNIYEFYFEEDIRNGLPWINLKVAREKGKCEHEGWRYKKDETKFYANTILIALFHPDRSLRGFAEVTREITPPKKALKK